MKHIFTSIGQYLAAALFVVAIFGAHGCSDSGTVNPVVELASLTVAPGTLDPAFSGATTQYTVQLSSDVPRVTITAQPATAGDTVRINGQTTTSSVITLNPAGQITPVNIVVSESDSNSRTYTVLLNRAGPGGNNSLQNLIVSPGNLAPSFNKNALRYAVTVDNGDGSIDITPELDDSNATLTVNGQPAISGQLQRINLNGPGSTTVIDIVITASNNTDKTYLVIVNRGTLSGNNFLRSLDVSPGPLVPDFVDITEDYTVNVGSTVDRIEVRPTLLDTTARLTVNGRHTNSGQSQPIDLNGPGSNTIITIRVTAQNDNQRFYTVNVIRPVPSGNSYLGSLTVSSGFLIPEFDENDTIRTMFSVSVDSTVPSITVTAAPQDGNATLRINGQPTNSRSIPLLDGPSSTEIEILVTPQNQSTPRRYTITVNRAAPGAPAPPASAPDLMDASDSGTSQTDNITNFLTPSFIVPQPAAGEIPNLYMAIGFTPLEKVQSSFDATTNTLTLTNPLSHGVYDITVTSTVTNANGLGLESPQSRSLRAHIVNVAP